MPGDITHVERLDGLLMRPKNAKQLDPSVSAMSFVALVAACVPANPASAQDSPLVGDWRLVSLVRETEGSAPSQYFGKHPSGELIFTANGRYFLIVLSEGRQVPKRDKDRVALFNGMMAHSGTYKVSGDKLIEHVEESWNAALTGTDQKSYIDWYETTLSLETSRTISVVDGKAEILTFTWERNH